MVKSIANEEGFEKYGRKLVEVTVSSIMSEDGHRGNFQNVLACCFPIPKSYRHLQLQVISISLITSHISSCCTSSKVASPSECLAKATYL